MADEPSETQDLTPDFSAVPTNPEQWGDFGSYFCTVPIGRTLSEHLGPPVNLPDQTTRQQGELGQQPPPATLSRNQIFLALQQELANSTQPPQEEVRAAHERDDLSFFHANRFWIPDDMINTLFTGSDMAMHAMRVPTPPAPGIFFVKANNINRWDADSLVWNKRREVSAYGPTGLLWTQVAYEAQGQTNLHKRSWIKGPDGSVGIIQYIDNPAEEQPPSLEERVGAVERRVERVRKKVAERFNAAKKSTFRMRKRLHDLAEGSGAADE